FQPPLPTAPTSAITAAIASWIDGRSPAIAEHPFVCSLAGGAVVAVTDSAAREALLVAKARARLAGCPGRGEPRTILPSHHSTSGITRTIVCCTARGWGRPLPQCVAKRANSPVASHQNPARSTFMTMRGQRGQAGGSLP